MNEGANEQDRSDGPGNHLHGVPCRSLYRHLSFSLSGVMKGWDLLDASFWTRRASGLDFVQWPAYKEATDKPNAAEADPHCDDHRTNRDLVEVMHNHVREPICFFRVLF